MVGNNSVQHKCKAWTDSNFLLSYSYAAFLPQAYMTNLMNYFNFLAKGNWSMSCPGRALTPLQCFIYIHVGRVGKSQAYHLYASQGLLHFQANTANPVSVPVCCRISVNRTEQVRLQIQKKQCKSSFRSMVQILIIFKSPVCLAEPAEPVTLNIGGITMICLRQE